MSDFTINRGDTSIFSVSVRTPEGTPADLRGATLKFGAKRKIDDTSFIFLATSENGGSITITDPVAGLATVRLLPSYTLSLEKKILSILWSCFVIMQNGDITTLDSGTLNIIPVVSS